MRVQVIRFKGKAARYYVNIPVPLAAALDLEAGEEVHWHLPDRWDLRLKRQAAPVDTCRKAKK